jgi:toxin ParE1/3/4
MSGQYLIRPRALADIDRYAGYIARFDRDAADRFVDAVEAACRRLAEMPGLGGPCELKARRFADWRTWVVTGFENYVIYYRESSGGVEVMRVLHGAMDAEDELRSGS